MDTKPDFQRLRTALLGGQPDRVPLFELGIARSIKEKYLGREVLSIPDEIDFAIKAGYDYIKLSPTIDMNPGKAVPKEGERITEMTDYSADRSWHASGKGIITNWEEFENFRWPQPNEIKFTRFEEAQHVLPENMKIVAQYGDIFTWVWDFMGFETFSFALIDNPELVGAMFDKIGSIVHYLFEKMADFDKVGALFYSDDIAINTGLFVSPNVYKQYLFPWMKKIGNLCKQHDYPFIYHTDGNIWKVLDDIKACGVNAIHPIEPQAMDIKELKQKYGKLFCLIGNVDVDLLSRGSREQVVDRVKYLLREIAPGGGYCLGSGNSVPEYVSPENFAAMVETVRELGEYQ